MLYQLHEMQRAFLNPLTAFAGAAADLYASPISPLSYTPMAREIAASYELLNRLGKEYAKPAFGIEGTREEIAVDKPFCQLRHFIKNAAVKPSGKTKVAPTILLVAPLSGHHSTLLRDTVRALVAEHNVYITDWRDARMVPLSEGKFDLDDYIAYVIEFVRLLHTEAKGNLHVISVCQPTVPVLAALSLMATIKDPATPKTMTMMGGPIDARQSPTEVNNLAVKKPFSWFENQVIYRVPSNYPGFGRRVYPGFLQHAGFVAMNPDRHMKSHWSFYKDLVKNDGQSVDAHRAFYDEYNAVLDMDADYYLDTIKIVFQDYALAYGTWVSNALAATHGPLKVNPAAITKTALFTIEGELDDISGSGQTRAAHALCSGVAKANKQHFEVPEAGHYGIFSGRRWRDIVQPKIAEFIRAHAK